MDPVGFLGGIVDGLLGFAGDAVGTAVGALFSFLGQVVDALAALAAHVLSILPDATDLGLSVPAGWIIGYQFMDAILPLHEALWMFGFLVTLRSAITVWHLAVTGYHLIPKPAVGT